MALEMYESQRCPACHNWDALVPIPSATRHVTWAEHNDRVAEVVAFRCVFCGAADLVKRDFAETHKDYKPVAGTASPMDGRLFAARPPMKED